MKSKSYYLWRFTFVNKFSLQITPPFLCFGSSLQNAENRIRKYFDKSIYDVHSSMCIKNRDFICVPAFTNFEIFNEYVD